MRLKKFIISIFLFLFPINVILAYSNEVVLGGQNIGIEVKTDGVLVVGLYKVNDELIALDSGIKSGDYITKVNGNNTRNISDFTKEILDDDDKKSVEVEYRRNNNYYNTNLKIVDEDNEYKTGLFIKDTVNGIGTLRLIDPSTNKFLALGHQIIDSTTNTILSINSGSIYNSYITGIKKSYDGSPGEKEAVSNSDERYGYITKNTDSGIFGIYEKEYDKENTITVAKVDEIKLGEASILTVIDKEEVKEYKINIEKIDTSDRLKNILFTITDEELLSKTGGVVQGMSGSPILQNGKLIGAVTHVIVDNCTRGYGISIVNMLSEADK